MSPQVLRSSGGFRFYIPALSSQKPPVWNIYDNMSSCHLIQLNWLCMDLKHYEVVRIVHLLRQASGAYIKSKIMIHHDRLILILTRSESINELIILTPELNLVCRVLLHSQNLKVMRKLSRVLLVKELVTPLCNILYFLFL